jgi:hypothetical protein
VNRVTDETLYVKISEVHQIPELSSNVDEDDTVTESLASLLFVAFIPE